MLMLTERESSKQRLRDCWGWRGGVDLARFTEMKTFRLVHADFNLLSPNPLSSTHLPVSVFRHNEPRFYRHKAEARTGICVTPALPVTHTDVPQGHWESGWVMVAVRNPPSASVTCLSQEWGRPLLRSSGV